MVDDYCCLNDEIHQCCCVCIHHRPLIIRSDEAIKTSKGREYNWFQIGWVCVEPIELCDRVLFNWPEHSIGCEMFDLWPYDKRPGKYPPNEFDEMMKSENFNKACKEFWENHPRKDTK
jgi:hypothetical protein